MSSKLTHASGEDGPPQLTNAGGEDDRGGEDDSGEGSEGSEGG